MTLTRLSTVFPVTLFVALAAGCGEKGPGPAEQYTAVLTALREGSLQDAYSQLMPSSYDRDLNGLLDRAKGLVSEEDFDALKALAAKAGESFSGALAGKKEEYPDFGSLSERLKELPSIVGLESFQQFRSLDVKALLGLVDRGLFAEVARLETVKLRLEAMEVKEVRRKKDWAQLLFTATEEDGEETEEMVQVILAGDKWVPTGWVVEWPKQVESWQKRFDDLERQAQEKPGIVGDSLRSLAPVLEGSATLLDGLLDRVERGTPGS